MTDEKEYKAPELKDLWIISPEEIEQILHSVLMDMVSEKKDKCLD